MYSIGKFSEMSKCGFKNMRTAIILHLIFYYSLWVWKYGNKDIGHQFNSCFGCLTIISLLCKILIKYFGSLYCLWVTLISPSFFFPPLNLFTPFSPLFLATQENLEAKLSWGWRDKANGWKASFLSFGGYYGNNHDRHCLWWLLWQQSWRVLFSHQQSL